MFYHYSSNIIGKELLILFGILSQMSIMEQIEINSTIQWKKVLHPKLNELQATAICGNDISSSCLYVSALTIMYASMHGFHYYL
jgi:hypothetical protein